MKRFNDGSIGSEGKVTLDNATFKGFNRYAYSNISEFYKTRRVPLNRKKDLVNLEYAENQINLKNISVKNVENKEITAKEYFESVNTDGLLIMKNDKVIYEEYSKYYAEQKTHLMLSATKSFVGLMISDEIKRGNLKRSDMTIKYIPELEGSGFENTTIGQLLDMQLNLKFSENYADPKADIWEYAVAMGMMSEPKGYTGAQTVRETLCKIKLENDSKDFLYTTPITDVVNWVLEKVTGRTFSDNLSHFFYNKYGFENEMQVSVDKVGVEIASGGLSVSLRDAARIGQILAHKGEYNDVKFIDDDVVNSLFTDDGSYVNRYQTSLQAKQKGRENWYYKNQVWVMNTEDEDFAFIGVYGQVIYVNIKQNVVIVKQGSNDAAADANLAYQIAIMQQVVSKI